MFFAYDFIALKVNSAVKFLDTEKVEQEEGGSSVHRLKSKHSAAMSRQQEIEMDHSVHFSSLTAADNGYIEISGPKVLETWHRMISPDCLIVGVRIHNTTGWLVHVPKHIYTYDC